MKVLFEGGSDGGMGRGRGAGRGRADGVARGAELWSQQQQNRVHEELWHTGIQPYAA